MRNQTKKMCGKNLLPLGAAIEIINWLAQTFEKCTHKNLGLSQISHESRTQLKSLSSDTVPALSSSSWQAVVAF